MPSAAGAIPTKDHWLRVFAQGVVIVGSILAGMRSNKLLLQSDRVFYGVRLRYAAPDLIRFAPAAEQQIR